MFGFGLKMYIFTCFLENLPSSSSDERVSRTNPQLSSPPMLLDHNDLLIFNFLMLSFTGKNPFII